MSSYNIHDKVKIRSDIYLPGLELFETNRKLEPDIVITIGNVKKNHDAVRIAENLYLISDGIMVYSPVLKLMLKKADDRFELILNKTNYNKILHRIMRILLALIQLKLTQINSTFLHASGVAIDNTAILFLGPMGSGKTQVLLQLLTKDKNIRALSNDFLIVDQSCYGYYYPSFTPLRSLVMLRKMRGLLKKVRVGLRLLVAKSSRGMLMGYPWISIQEFAETRIADKAKISALILLKRGSNESISKNRLVMCDPCEIIRRLAIQHLIWLNHIVSVWPMPYFYYYLHTQEDIWGLKILESIVNNTKAWILYMDKETYHHKILRKILQCL